MKNFQNLLVFIIWVLAFSTGYAQQVDQNNPIPPAPDIKIGKLANGLSYYIKANKKPEQRIELRLAINAGSICEIRRTAGAGSLCANICASTGQRIFPAIK